MTRRTEERERDDADLGFRAKRLVERVLIGSISWLQFEPARARAVDRRIKGLRDGGKRRSCYRRSTFRRRGSLSRRR